MNPSTPTQTPIAIIGAGFAGMCVAIELKQAGIEEFTIVEAGDEFGGTWRDNTYPGCACDIPSHLYSFSFEQNPHWSRAYSPQPEIQRYIVEVADKYELYDHVRFDTEIRAARFDQTSGCWTLTTDTGEVIDARVVVLGVGGLSRPKIPQFAGLDDFDGVSFHSARWDHDYDLRGKRVAAIGTGASAIQFIPEIAPQVDQLHVFQRTPPWVLPRPDRKFPDWQKRLFDFVPPVHWAYRKFIYWLQEMRAVGFVSRPGILKFFERFGRRHIEACIDDPELRRKVTPEYTMGCKRILMSNDYYQSLDRPNVEVVCESVDHFTAGGIVTDDGVEREVDAVIFGTGFHVTDFLSHVEVTGLDGRDLNDAWRDGAEAYYGLAVSGFPNLFMMVGPNTGLGHNSIIFMIESQARLVRQAIEALDEYAATYMDVRPSVHRDFNDSLQERMGQTVWKSGCESWYLEDNGKNTTLWPGYTVEYWLRTRRLKLQDFRLTWGEAS